MNFPSNGLQIFSLHTIKQFSAVNFILTLQCKDRTDIAQLLVCKTEGDISIDKTNSYILVLITVKTGTSRRLDKGRCGQIPLKRILEDPGESARLLANVQC